MLLVVGERVHNPRLTAEKRLRWMSLWERDPLRCCLTIDGMSWGPTRDRLAKLLGSEPDKVVNLLWPDNKPGTWNAEEARKVAQKLRLFIEAPDKEVYLTTEQGNEEVVSQIVLCGTKVLDAWFPSMTEKERKSVWVPGHLWHWRGIWHMWMPHPSGMNRMWHDPKVVEAVKSAAAELQRLSRDKCISSERLFRNLARTVPTV